MLPRREAAIHFLFSIPLLLLLCHIVIINIIINIMTIIIIVHAWQKSRNPFPVFDPTAATLPSPDYTQKAPPKVFFHPKYFSGLHVCNSSEVFFYSRSPTPSTFSASPLYMSSSLHVLQGEKIKSLLQNIRLSRV